MWMGVPFWVTPLFLSGLATGVLYLIVRELFNSGPALATVAMAWALMAFRFTSLAALSQIPSLLLGLIAVYATLRCGSCRCRGGVVAAVVRLTTRAPDSTLRRE